jgi:hypothetical protein
MPFLHLFNKLQEGRFVIFERVRELVTERPFCYECLQELCFHDANECDLGLSGLKMKSENS